MLSRKKAKEAKEEEDNNNSKNSKSEDDNVIQNDEEVPEPAIQETLYTKRLTVDQYEKSKFENTAKSLRELLDKLLSDKQMKPQIKRRHLNEIKRQYPHIIQSKFGVLSEKQWLHLVKTLAG